MFHVEHSSVSRNSTRCKEGVRRCVAAPRSCTAGLRCPHHASGLGRPSHSATAAWRAESPPASEAGTLVWLRAITTARILLCKTPQPLLRLAASAAGGARLCSSFGFTPSQKSAFSCLAATRTHFFALSVSPASAHVRRWRYFSKFTPLPVYNVPRGISNSNFHTLRRTANVVF